MISKAIKNISQIYLPEIFQKINVYNFESYKFFFILKNLKKKNSRYKSLLKDIISEPLFLIYVYKVISNKKNHTKLENLLDKVVLKKININWFVDLSENLKKNNFKWNSSRKIHLHKKLTTKNLIINCFTNFILQKALYIVFFEIYDKKLNYFSKHCYGFNANKNSHSALREIKFKWSGINWCIKFDLKEAFSSLKKDNLIKLLKQNIHDQALFLLLNKMWSNNAENGNKSITWKEDFSKNKILLHLLLNIYTTSLDNYIEKFTDQYSNNFTKIKYLRYLNKFICGVKGKKETAFRYKQKIINFMSEQLSLEINEKKVKLINLWNNSVSFLSCKIRSIKKFSLLPIKSKIKEHNFRTQNDIKVWKKIKKNKSFKKEMDNAWNSFKKNPKSFSKIIDSSKDNSFKTIEKNFLDIVKWNRRKGLKKLIKHVFLQTNSNFAAKNSFQIQNQIFFKHRNKIIKKKSLGKKNLVKLILKYKDHWFCNRRYKLSYLVKNIESFSSKTFFLSNFLFVKLPLDIKFKSIYDKNKINFLVDTIKYLKTNSKDKKILKNQFSNLNLFFHEFVINANIKLIYSKLKENEIVQQTKMKVDTKKSILLLDDYKIITFFSSLAKTMLNYFACCSNFLKVKFIVRYYIRLSLGSTLKQKYKMSSLDKTFKNYGENVNVWHPYKKNYKISFLSQNNIHHWPKSFQVKSHRTINDLPFKNISIVFKSVYNKYDIKI